MTRLLTISASALFAAVAVLAVPGPAQALDRASMECVECHGGFISDGAATLATHPGGTSHTIGMDYRAAAAADPGLTPASELDPRLVLADGLVGCATCHVPYSAADHEALVEARAAAEQGEDPSLNIEPRASRLCLACHRK